MACASWLMNLDFAGSALPAHILILAQLALLEVGIADVIVLEEATAVAVEMEG